MLLDGKQGRGTRKERPSLSLLNDAELDLRNMGVKERLAISAFQTHLLRQDTIMQFRNVLRAISRFIVLTFSCMYLI
jgi:hypothetical protein